MEEQNKSHFWRFAVGLVLLMALGLGIYYATGWYKWRNAQSEAAANDRALQDMKELEAQYENDTYGGKTPEETLALFIDALKKGDIDLASKYFVIDEREKAKADLSMLDSLRLMDLASEMKNGNFVRREERFAKFEYRRGAPSKHVFFEEKEVKIDTPFVASPIDFIRLENNLWKILLF